MTESDPAMIRAVIVEDEPLARRYLADLLTTTGKVEIAGAAPDAEIGLFLCAHENPDAVFLDIRLPGPDGLALASHLSRLEHPPLVVFTTGFRDYACRAIRADAVDYLLKPLDPDQVNEAVARLESRQALRSGVHPPHDRWSDKLPVKHGRDDVVELVPRWQIAAAVVHDGRTWIHTATSEFATYYALAKLKGWLGAPAFIQLNRQAIVNLQSIDEVEHFGDRLYRVRLRDRERTRLVSSRSGAVRLHSLLEPPF